MPQFRNKNLLRKSGILINVLILLTFYFYSTNIAKSDVSSAVQYLKTKESNPWLTMALVANGEMPNVDYLKTASGTKAINFEAPILAIAAAGKDPRTFPNENLIEKLKSFYKDGQIGDASILNDDIFGILALIAAGEKPENPEIAGPKNFILQHQSIDGGWSFMVSEVNSDTNTTAAAIMALLETGISKTEPAIQNAVNYLKNSQNNDGGFPYAPKSEWGTDSDAASTAWVISAIYKLNEEPKNWSKNNKNPIDYLLSLQSENGFFQNQPNSGEDSFTPITTSYAVIALSGKYYPVGKVVFSDFPKVNYKIEGSKTTLCSGDIYAPTALELVKIVASECGFTYHIQETFYGPYLEQIGSDKAQGMLGWLYTVNMKPISEITKGAADYVLKEDDEVLWYYGDFNWKLARINLEKSEIVSGETVKVQVESLEQAGWLPLQEAMVYAGSFQNTTDAKGEAVFTLPDGTYKIFAEKEGYVRSSDASLFVGVKRELSIPLSVIIEALPDVSGKSTPDTEISFMIDTNPLTDIEDNDLDFGNAMPGNLLKRNISLSNKGTVKIYTEAVVNGDEIFKDYLKIEQKDWRKFNAVLQNGESKNASVGLDVPENYSNPGVKNGTLVFWAMKTN